jgi:drug/metabolite transporter (DMT)-like permease
MGYVYGSVSTVQIIKSMEPVCTFIADVFVFKTENSAATVVGLALVIFGSVWACYADPTMNAVAIGAAMLSNAVLPMRNVLTKKIARPASSMPEGCLPTTKQVKLQEPKGVLLFCLLSALGAVYVGSAAIVSILLFSIAMTPDPGILFQALASSLMYTGYNSFSFLVLGRMEPVRHAIFNVFKRAFNILTSMLFFGLPITSQFMIGLSIAMFGLIVYSFGKAKYDMGVMVTPAMALISFLAIGAIGHLHVSMAMGMPLSALTMDGLGA